MGDTSDPFDDYELKCGREHEPVPTIAADEQPDQCRVRRYRCPICDQVFRVAMSSDGATTKTTRE